MFSTCLSGFGFGFAGAVLVQALHWRTVLEKQKVSRLNYRQRRMVALSAVIVVCSACLSVVGVLVVPLPYGYLASALIGISPLQMLKALWKRPQRRPKPAAPIASDGMTFSLSYCGAGLPSNATFAEFLRPGASEGI